MTHIALLSTASPAMESALPALELLPHRVRVHAPDESSALTGSARPDVVIVDGTRNLVTARNTAVSLSGLERPLPVPVSYTHLTLPTILLV